MGEILLDTTYILPIFGINIGLKNFETHFPVLLTTSHVLYTPLSIVEAKWVVLRLARKRPAQRKDLLETYRKGLSTLLGEGRLIQTTFTKPEIEEIADVLLIDTGIRDYFDRLIYATSIYYNAVLMTEDQELVNLTNVNHLPKPIDVINWNNTVQELIQKD